VEFHDAHKQRLASTLAPPKAHGPAGRPYHLRRAEFHDALTQPEEKSALRSTNVALDVYAVFPTGGKRMPTF
jgi:hypothetical protein